MHRIDHPTAQADKFGVGKSGFTGGNPATATPSTRFTPEWCDDTQENICRVIEVAGIALVKGNGEQLYQAIAELIAASAATGLKALAYLDAGQGLEGDGVGNARVKLDGATLVRSAAGLRVAEAVMPAAAATALAIKVTTNTAISITAAEMVLSGPDRIRVAPVAVTISTATAGAGGLDTGMVTNSTWYAVWAIAKPDGTTAGLLSTSATAPTLPGGYTYKVRLGWVRTNASGLLYRTIQYGRRVQYIVDGTVLTGMPQLAAGVAGNVSTPTWVAVSVSAWVPSTASIIHAGVASSSNSGIVFSAAPNANYGSYSSTTNPPPVNPNTYTAGYSGGFSFVLESTNIYWANGSTTGILWCNGWEDNI